MARINLLPWRDEQRQEKKKEFFTVLGGFAILGALCGYVWVSTMQGAIDDQSARNKRLDDEIKVLNSQVEEIQELKQRRAELIDRMEVIQSLQGTRPVIVRYFDEFVRAVPEGLWITNIERNGEIFTIQGVGESTQRVTTFMRNLDNSEWFQDPDVPSIDQSPEFGVQAQQFTIIVTASEPVREEQEVAGAS